MTSNIDRFITGLVGVGILFWLVTHGDAATKFASGLAPVPGQLVHGIATA